MKKRLNFLSSLNAKGFTLIELLVVIGILGILSSALVATIDPFEQIKKGNDANVKNVAVEYSTALIRYYMTHNGMPWYPVTAVTAEVISGNVGLGYTQLLITDGELKTAFTTATSVTKNILVSGGTNSAVVCFKPESKSQQKDQNTKFNSSGVDATGCKSFTPAGTSDCYWCAVQ